MGEGTGEEEREARVWGQVVVFGLNPWVWDNFFLGERQSSERFADMFILAKV